MLRLLKWRRVSFFYRLLKRSLTPALNLNGRSWSKQHNEYDLKRGNPIITFAKCKNTFKTQWALHHRNSENFSKNSFIILTHFVYFRNTFHTVHNNFRFSFIYWRYLSNKNDFEAYNLNINTKNIELDFLLIPTTSQFYRILFYFFRVKTVKVIRYNLKMTTKKISDNWSSRNTSNIFSYITIKCINFGITTVNIVSLAFSRNKLYCCH